MQTIDVFGSRIAMTDQGAGVPVVMLHCSAADSSQWDALRGALGAGFRTVAPDQWACGGSDPWPGHQPFTLVMEARAVKDLIGASDEPVHLIGHSYGGAVALRVARERPAAIRSLTVIEPSAFNLLRQDGPRSLPMFEEIAAVAETVRRTVLSEDLTGGMAYFVDYWNGQGAWAEMSERARAMLVPRVGKVLLDFRALFLDDSLLEDLARLEVPTLILHGDRSPAPSRRIVELLADTLPDVLVEPVAGAGHMSPVSHPETVNALIAGFIKYLVPASVRSRARVA